MFWGPKDDFLSIGGKKQKKYQIAQGFVMFLGPKSEKIEN